MTTMTIPQSAPPADTSVARSAPAAAPTEAVTKGHDDAERERSFEQQLDEIATALAAAALPTPVTPTPATAPGATATPVAVAAAAAAAQGGSAPSDGQLVVAAADLTTAAATPAVTPPLEPEPTAAVPAVADVPIDAMTAESATTDPTVTVTPSAAPTGTTETDAAATDTAVTETDTAPAAPAAPATETAETTEAVDLGEMVDTSDGGDATSDPGTTPAEPAAGAPESSDASAPREVTAPEAPVGVVADRSTRRSEPARASAAPSPTAGPDSLGDNVEPPVARLAPPRSLTVEVADELLGPMRVVASTDQRLVNLDITTADAQLRDSILGRQHELRGELADAGVQLGTLDVGDGGRDAGQPADAEARRRRLDADGVASPAPTVIAQPGQPHTGADGRLDLRL